MISNEVVVYYAWITYILRFQAARPPRVVQPGNDLSLLKKSLLDYPIRQDCILQVTTLNKPEKQHALVGVATC